MKIYVPPVKCQGIKTKLVPWIKTYAQLPSHGQWVEPFMGSGVVGFNMRPPYALFADLNPHVIAFYNAIKSGYMTAATAKSFLEKEGKQLVAKGEEHYYFIRDRFNNHNDPFDFLFLNRACFNGVIRFNKKGCYNVPFGHKPERFAPAYVTKIINQIQYVEKAMRQYDWSFVCADFRSIVKTSTHQDFFYFDPPYIGRHTDYYGSWSDKDETDLFDILVSTPVKFILSTWHSNQYRVNPSLARHVAHFEVLTKEHFYHVGANVDNRNAVVEALVLNYLPAISNQTPETALIEIKQLQLLEANLNYPQ